MADQPLRLWRQGRGVSCRLRRVGVVDHPAQGPDADPLQDRHHHLWFRRLQSLAVHSVVGHHARRALFYRSAAAESVRRYHTRPNREASWLLGCGGDCSTRLRLRDRRPDHLVPLFWTTLTRYSCTMFHFLRADPWGAHRHVRSLACAVLLCLVVT